MHDKVPLLKCAAYDNEYFSELGSFLWQFATEIPVCLSDTSNTSEQVF